MIDVTNALFKSDKKEISYLVFILCFIKLFGTLPIHEIKKFYLKQIALLNKFYLKILRFVYSETENMFKIQFYHVAFALKDSFN